MVNYTYDALGNRTAWKINGAEKAGYRYDAMNRLTAADMDGVPYSYTYDRRGNLTEEKNVDSLIRQSLGQILQRERQEVHWSS